MRTARKSIYALAHAFDAIAVKLENIENKYIGTYADHTTKRAIMQEFRDLQCVLKAEGLIREDAAIYYELDMKGSQAYLWVDPLSVIEAVEPFKWPDNSGN